MNEMFQLMLAQASLQGWLLGVGGAVSLMAFFLMKHLVVDFFLQPPYMWKNKGKLLHPGGWLHAGLHGLTTILLLFMVGDAGVFTQYLGQVTFLAAVETLAHFFTDFAKVKILNRTGWKPDTSPRFWYLLGVDQFLHQMVYAGMVLYWLSTP